VVGRCDSSHASSSMNLLFLERKTLGLFSAGFT
jgi:hypothetical protein